MRHIPWGSMYSKQMGQFPSSSAESRTALAAAASKRDRIGGRGSHFFPLDPCLATCSALVTCSWMLLMMSSTWNLAMAPDSLLILVKCSITFSSFMLGKTSRICKTSWKFHSAFSHLCIVGRPWHWQGSGWGKKSWPGDLTVVEGRESKRHDKAWKFGPVELID